MGGPSTEREVSLNTGAGILAALQEKGYNAVGIDLDPTRFVEQLKDYIMKNILFTKNYFKENHMKIDFHIPEATYLLWLDFSRTNLDHESIKKLLLTKAKVALNDGVSFSNKQNRHFRLNTALSQKALEVALNQLLPSFK